MKISNKLYNNGCNTLIDYLLTISYQSLICRRIYTLRSPYCMSRPSVSVICDVVAPYPEG